MTILRVEKLSLPGVRLGEENPLPFFRDPKITRFINVDPSVPDSKQELLGWETGFRVLPYRMQDNYTRQLEPLTFDSIILENEFLRAIFLPELGGRLVSLLYKPKQHELLCINPVFQPANLAIRNAWFSGGIEWNVGQLGHAFSTCSPIFAAAIKDEQGEPGLRLYEFERCKRIFWQIDFYLPTGSKWLIAHTRINNPNKFETPIYWWTNIAIPETPDVRVLAPARKALFADYMNGNSTDLSYGDLPHLPTLDGKDSTYALNSHFANEFFFQCDETDFLWEAALDKHGCGLVEASTTPLRYRKLFCWGSHQGGRHWQEFLSPGGHPYIEIQAGLAPTQLHGLKMLARADWHWTQIFSYLQADPIQVHAKDWEIAIESTQEALSDHITSEQLAKLNEIYCSRADLPPEEILHTASGWGALEMLCRDHTPGSLSIPPSFVFPESTLGEEQIKWVYLLQEGVLPEQPTTATVGDWMVQDEWRILLESSLENPKNQNWFAFLHLGVMCMENFDEEGARNAWLKSIIYQPSSMAWRNLAILAGRQKQSEKALEFLAKAWHLNSNISCSTGLAREYLSALSQAKRYEEGLSIYNSFPEELRNDDRIQILHARIALELGDLEEVVRLTQKEYAVVREGETELTDIWFEMAYRSHTEKTKETLTDTLRAEIRRQNPPPTTIDFRSYTKED